MKKNKHHALPRTFFVTGLLVLAFFSCSKKASSPSGTNPVIVVDAEMTINANDLQQSIAGFGCATVFVPATTSLAGEELDRLFGNGPGQLGFNILRIRVTADNQWRLLELANAKGAIQRGAKILATPWSPPVRFKTNNNLIGGSLITDSGAAYARYLNDFANYMSANGAPIYAISVQNEPDIKVSYESCDWTSSEMLNFLKDHGHLVTSTKLMAPESFNNNQTYVNSLLSNTVAASNIDIVGGHIYGSGIVENTMAKTLNKEVWMTEHLDTNYSYTASLATAAEIHDCLTKANFSAYIWWYGKRFYGPIGENGLVTVRGSMMSHFSKFIPAGSVRLGSTNNTRQNTRISAYKTSAGKKIIVAVNSDAAEVNQTINISNATIGEVMPYTTTSSSSVQQGTKVSVNSNKFVYKLPPSSVTTFVEQ